MLKNYFKIALRNLRKQKLYSFINIFSLSVGIACSILVYLYVQHELSYDTFHEAGNRIYRVQEVRYETDEASRKQPSFFNTGAVEEVRKSPWMPLPLGPLLEENYPEVEHTVRYDETDALLRNGKTVFEESITLVDESFLQVFSFKLLKGNPATALQDQHSIVLTPAIARKYFGEGNAVGQYLNVKIQDKEALFTVTGIVEAPPANSSVRFDALLPIANKAFYEFNIERWNNFNTAHFIELMPGSDAQQFEQKLNTFVQERYKDSIEERRTRNKMSSDAKVMEFTLTPIADIHLDAAVNWPGVSNPLYTYLLSGIALLILLIGCINYITLALTRSSNRAKEVGIRKTVGAHRKQVALQFFGETLLLTVLALIAGSYPALFLSKFNTADVFKSQSNYRFRPRLIKILLVFQYSLLVFLIISSVVMYRQLDYVSQKELGYEEEQVVVVPTHTGWNEEGTALMQRYRDALASVPGVADVSGMAPAFTTGSNVYGFDVEGESKSSFIYYVDAHFLSTIGLELVQGRNFSGDSPSECGKLYFSE